MPTTLATPPKVDRVRDGETRVVIHNMDWETYERLCDRTAEQHIRMTYDRGTLELMSPSSRHERYKGYSGSFVEELAMELDEIGRVRPYLETTWKRAHAGSGLEADQCYYFDAAKLDRIAGRDPDRPDDPLPDLAIEIEISSSAVNKMGVYAALGFAEVWRTDGESATFERLGPDGAYHAGERSLFLPITPDDWLQWLWRSDDAVDQKDWKRNLRAWIHEELRHRA